jgi:hypothetical protein
VLLSIDSNSGGVSGWRCSDAICNVELNFMIDDRQAKAKMGSDSMGRVIMLEFGYLFN